MKKRPLIQLVFLIFSLGILTFVIVIGKKSIHNLCPYALVCFGAMKGNLWNLSLGLASLGIFLGIIFMIAAMFWGRIFCGYVCPLGTIQELIYCLRRKRKTGQIPYFAERKLRKIKYGILALTVILALMGLGWLYINFCPIYALSRLPALAFFGLGVLAIILLGGFYLERFWCRFLCPYAALLNISEGLGSLFGISRSKVQRNLERCVDCGICCQSCPMNIDILEDEYVHSPDCIHCLRCSQKCPKPDTICIKKEQ
jgi:polyferredoxin